MKKVIYLTLSLLIIFFVFIGYLSLIGIETKRFNNQIDLKAKEFNKDLNIRLDKIKLTLNPFKLELNIKTLGPKLTYKKKDIDFEYIKSQISLRSLVTNEFSISNLEASTKSLEIKKLISFTRSLNKSAELFVLEKIIKKGYLIADIKLNFDNYGKLKDNFKINGFVKDTKIKIFDKYQISKINFIFNLNNENLDLREIETTFNGLKFLSNKLSVKKVKDELYFDGEIENKDLVLDNEKIELLIKPFFKSIEVKKIKFNSKNSFSFNVNKKLKFNNLKLKSKVNIDDLSILNNLKMKKFFPNIKEEINFLNQRLEIKYDKNNLNITGLGNILLQNEVDEINYFIDKKDKIYNFKIVYEMMKNPMNLDFLNYKKVTTNKSLIEIEGSKELEKKTKFNSISLREKDNKISIKNLILNKYFKVIDLTSAEFDFFDKAKNLNRFEINKDKNIYYLKGSIFNAKNLIDNLINDNDTPNILSKDFKISIKLDNLLMDEKYELQDFNGDLLINNQTVKNAKLTGYFSENKKFNFTVKSIDNKKITTLFVDEAETIISRYKFIKGFKGGSLDFYSSKSSNGSVSKIKIYDFKLKELPALTKLLTLASLQGIADLLSGEGISFDEFEMSFHNEDNVMTINEIYAIGPAISILMEGYVEKNKLISLRGTLVPATTINKAIGSIPVLGDILVGSKTGEGIFGVSFKIKGSPKDLETTVNPIKTLTPRFITRTLEKIKKN